MVKPQLVHGGSFLAADRFFAAVQLCGNLPPRQALNKQAHHLQLPPGKTRQRRSGLGAGRGLRLQNIGKARAQVITALEHAMDCAFQLFQRAAFIEQPIYPDVE
ncbi:hypothetical protein D3C87_1795360 [compost metagenome]